MAFFLYSKHSILSRRSKDHLRHPIREQCRNVYSTHCRWLRPKWFIKIMAELGYTMPAPLFNDRDRLLLFQSYKGSARMGMLDRLQLQWIRMKMTRIGKHTDNIMKTRRKLIT